MNKKFGVVLADPPWAFKSWSKKGTGRSADQHYDVVSLEDIKALPVRNLAAKDCCLFLWTVDCMLPQGLEVMEAWGFQFKTVAFTWAKQSATEQKWHMGLGYWTRRGTEQCLLGTIGKPKPLSHSVRQLVVAPSVKHSKKPPEIHGRIEQLVGGLIANCSQDRREKIGYALARSWGRGFLVLKFLLGILHNIP